MSAAKPMDLHKRVAVAYGTTWAKMTPRQRRRAVKKGRRYAKRLVAGIGGGDS